MKTKLLRKVRKRFLWIYEKNPTAVEIYDKKREDSIRLYWGLYVSCAANTEIQNAVDWMADELGLKHAFKPRYKKKEERANTARKNRIKRKFSILNHPI